MNFDWDPAKDERNRRERGFGFDVAVLIFTGETVDWLDERHDYGEVRIRVVGEVDGRIMHLVYTDRGDTRRIISARAANRRERTIWLNRQ